MWNLTLEFKNYDVVLEVLHFDLLLFGIVINQFLNKKFDSKIWLQTAILNLLNFILLGELCL